MVARRVLSRRPREAPWTGRRDCVRRRLGRRFGRSGVGARRIVRLIRRVVRRRGARLDTALQRALRRRSRLHGNRLGSRSTLKVGKEKCQGQPGERHGDGGEHPPQPSGPRGTWFRSLHSKLIEAARCGDSGGARGRWSLWPGLDRAGLCRLAERCGEAARCADRGGARGHWSFGRRLDRAGLCGFVERRGERAGGGERGDAGVRSSPKLWLGATRAGVRRLAEQEPRANSQIRVDEHELGAHWVVPLSGRRHVRTRRHDTIIGFPDRSLHLRSHLFHQ